MSYAILPRYPGESQAEYDDRCKKMLAWLSAELDARKPYTAARPYEIHPIQHPIAVRGWMNV